MSPSSQPKPQLAPGLEQWLKAGAGRTGPCERLIETSISRVFLYRDRVLKLKKPVDFGFVDFTTCAKRRWAVERELAFNRATAPDIYRAMHAITRTADGRFVMDGPGEVVDWALEMRRFDETAVLSETPQLVGGDFAEDLGRQIARFHAAAPRGAQGGGAEGLAMAVASNARQFDALQTAVGREAVGRVLSGTAKALETVATLLDERLRAGFVRRCHGDLHLGNILREDGRAVLFDCIEFNDALSEIDVLYDLAFLLMDLGLRDQVGGANRVLNGWCDEAAGPFGEDLWRGLAALSLFQAIRATVRAHVCGHAADIPEAQRYLRAADAHLRPAAPVLAAVGGPSGSGKSTFARALAPTIPPSPGAVVLRSDEIRKRLWGRAPTDHLPPEAYTPDVSATVYETMFRLAKTCLQAGWPVVLDAAFLDPQARAQAQALAAETQVAFEGVWLEAPADLLRRRVAARRGDASDADLRVLEAQLARDPGPVDWSRNDAGDLDGAVRAVAERLRAQVQRP